METVEYCDSSRQRAAGAFRSGLTVIAAVVLLLAGCATTPGALPYPPIPAPRTEMVPNPPVSQEQLVWQPGHWEWIGDGYDWHNGSWVLLGSHSKLWQDGSWSQVDGKWTWNAGHWL